MRDPVGEVQFAVIGFVLQMDSSSGSDVVGLIKKICLQLVGPVAIKVSDRSG